MPRQAVLRGKDHGRLPPSGGRPCGCSAARVMRRGACRGLVCHGVLSARRQPTVMCRLVPKPARRSYLKPRSLQGPPDVTGGGVGGEAAAGRGVGGNLGHQSRLPHLGVPWRARNHRGTRHRPDPANRGRVARTSPMMTSARIPGRSRRGPCCHCRAISGAKGGGFGKGLPTPGQCRWRSSERPRRRYRPACPAATRWRRKAKAVASRLRPVPKPSSAMRNPSLQAVRAGHSRPETHDRSRPARPTD